MEGTEQSRTQTLDLLCLEEVEKITRGRAERSMDAKVAAVFPGRWCAPSPTMASRLRGRGSCAAARLEETKMKSEIEDSTLDDAPVFISRSGNGCGFIMATISVAVAAQSGNGMPRSCGFLQSPQKIRRR